VLLIVLMHKHLSSHLVVHDPSDKVALFLLAFAYHPVMPCLTYTFSKPFTIDFPHTNINKLLSPDLLHQLIKGAFKDHLITWVNNYIKLEYPELQAWKILDDIDQQYYVFFYIY
jgi:hypothetical protein